ncbi:MAG: AAA family ATPase [Deltaproteobacteria bacterium]|nr:AAA family ATPase [Deltaproteobacteria bacterium]MBI4797051.1 AAA family ATPase [Deltaproteobacteria bacterium]
MSFIDKALEKAKTLHKKKTTADSPPEAEPIFPPITPVSPLGLGDPEVVPPEISYSITRTVAVDPEIMRRNRLIAGGGEVADAVAEGFKLLRTHILQRTKTENKNTLMITGPQPGEGKTLTAINLAISIAQEVNQTVLLVDADLRAPSVHRYFGLETQEGLVDYLTAGVPIRDLLIHPQGLAKLVVLPGGRPATNAAELINSPLMADLVQELKHYYPNRYVLFDLPPLLAFADSLAFAPLVDGIMVVVEACKTSREDIERCREMLQKFNLLGFVLNKAESVSRKYDYQDDNLRWKEKLWLFK